MSAPDRPDSPIEHYLDALTVRLRAGDPRALRHLLAETEAHLRDDAEAAEATGMTTLVAEEHAVARLGPVDVLASSELDRQRPRLGELLRRTAVSAVVLGSIGAVAVGISGVVAAVIRAAGGASAVASPGTARLTSADCTRWLAIYPHAANCRAAATADWASEAVFYRIALGILGLAALAGLAVARRRAPRLAAEQLPRVMVDTIGATLFVVAGGWTLALGIDALVGSSGTGWGQWLSATPVALAAAAVFAMRAVRDLRGPAAAVSLPG